ncbi:MAG: DNA-processing protein DprA [Planctomycetota bacterium]|jgi:DNA processing protein|nr:DNA-processing protein DprA [Planctomycetota bacterium]
MPDAAAYLRLALVPGLGSITAHRLLDIVDTPAEVFNLPMRNLQAVDGIGGERARRIVDPRGNETVEAEQARCHQLGLRIVTLADPDYPKALRALSDPPLALWIKGSYEEQDRVGIAVVGPRTPSSYGHRQARLFSQGLARGGATVISGLARGIDTVAHEAALAVNGRTIAVIGSGFDHLYPKENADLAERIADGHGCVLSEFPCATRPNQGTFPRRNRVVAALALATLVIEAGQRSGALITARLSGELGKEALVLPGPIDRPEHVGSNKLLRDGATLITSLDDVYQELPPLATMAAASTAGPADENNSHTTSLSQRERDIYKLLSDDPRSVDDLQRVCQLPSSQVTATMISLELRRLARKTPGGYVRAL